MNTFSISGHIIDLFERKIFPGEVTIENGIIAAISETNSAPDVYLMPGLWMRIYT